MARSITREGMVYASFPILKHERADDGSDDLIIYGKATDGSIDSDRQIVDPQWSGPALEKWLRTAGNVRVQHSPHLYPAGKGIAVEVDRDGDGAHWVKARIVEDTAKKLVKAGVLQDFSVGIAHPLIIRDRTGKAAGGVVTGNDDTEIAELSIVDRGSNRNSGFALVKAAALTEEPWTLGDLDELLAKAEKAKPDDRDAEDDDEDASDGPEDQADGEDDGDQDDTTNPVRKAYDAEVAAWRDREPRVQPSDIPTGTAFLAKQAARDAWQRWDAEGDDNALDGTDDGFARWCAKRDIDPNVGGGVDRDKLPARDFVDPAGRRFPIDKPGDVSDAVSSYGRAQPLIPMRKFRKRLTAIAQRKGPEFVAQLPASWNTAGKTDMAEADLDKNITATSPDPTGLVPYNLAGARKSAKKCPKCGRNHHADSKLRRCEGCGAKLPRADKDTTVDMEKGTSPLKPGSKPAGAHREPDGDAVEALEHDAGLPTDPDESHDDVPGSVMKGKGKKKPFPGAAAPFGSHDDADESDGDEEPDEDDDAEKAFNPDLIKVGPKGYEHGWVFVGAPGVGAVVHHPEHGKGTVTRAGKKTSAVSFESGQHASFEHGAKGGKGAHFVERATGRKPKVTEAAKPKHLSEVAKEHGIKGGYDKTWSSTLHRIHQEHGGNAKATATALRRAAKGHAAQRKALPSSGYEQNQAMHRHSERALRQLADVVEGKAKANKSVDAPYTVKRMHDALCAAYDWDEVAAEYPSLKSVADAVVPGFFTGEVAKAAQSGDMGLVTALAGTAQAASELHAGHVEAAKLADARDWLHKSFDDMYPDTKLSPGAPPQPGQFQRPYISAGHAPLTAPSSRTPSIPPAVHVPDPDQFTRGLITEGHEAPSPSNKGNNLDTPTVATGASRTYYRNASRDAARNAMQAMHDHIAQTFPDMCPMAASKSVLPADMGDTNRPRPVAPASTRPAPGELTKGYAPGYHDTLPLADVVTRKELKKLIKSARRDAVKAVVGVYDTELAALRAEIDELGSMPDPAQAPVRGAVVRKAATVDAAPPARKVSVVEKAQARAVAEHAEYLTYLQKAAQSDNPATREQAEALLDELLAKQP